MSKQAERLVELAVAELKPGRKYIMAFDEHSITAADADRLGKILNDHGVDVICSVLTNGSPTETIKIIEQEGTKQWRRTNEITG